MRFYLNNVVPPNAELKRTYQLSFNKFLCEHETSLLYINKSLVNENLVHDTYSVIGNRWENYCLRIQECEMKIEVI